MGNTYSAPAKWEQLSRLVKRTENNSSTVELKSYLVSCICLSSPESVESNVALQPPFNPGKGEQVILCSVTLTGVTVTGTKGSGGGVTISLDGTTPEAIRELLRIKRAKVEAKSKSKPEPPTRSKASSSLLSNALRPLPPSKVSLPPLPSSAPPPPSSAPPPPPLLPSITPQDSTFVATLLREEDSDEEVDQVLDERELASGPLVLEEKLQWFEAVTNKEWVSEGCDHWGLNIPLLRREGVANDILKTLLDIQHSIHVPETTSDCVALTLVSHPIIKLVVEHELIPRERIKVGKMMFDEVEFSDDLAVRIDKMAFQELCDTIHTRVFDPLVYLSEKDGLRLKLAWKAPTKKEGLPAKACIQIRVTYLLIKKAQSTPHMSGY